MGSRKQRSAIDTVRNVVNRVQETWVDRKPVYKLLLNLNGAFDHVSRNKLLYIMESMESDSILIHWREVLMSDRNLSLVIDGPQ